MEEGMGFGICHVNEPVVARVTFENSQGISKI
jgi:hypothetical protein